MSKKTLKKRVSSNKMVTCAECLHSNLLRYDRNPIIAECTRHIDGFLFKYQREIASAPRICEDFTKLSLIHI